MYENRLRESRLKSHLTQEELADSGYNWEQLKIMRIKFLSEYGN